MEENKSDEVKKEEVKNQDSSIQLLEKESEVKEEKQEQSEEKNEIAPNTEQIETKQEDTENKENEKKDEEVKEEATQLKVIENEEENKEEIKKKGKTKKVIIIVFVILLILVALFFTIFAILNLRNTKIIRGVQIGEINVSDMSKEDAKALLDERNAKNQEKQLVLKYGDLENKVTYSSLAVNYQIDEAINNAYNIGRDGNIFENNLDILKTWKDGENIELKATVDTEKLNQVVQNINNTIQGAVVQPSYEVKDDKLIITSGKTGIKVDESKLTEYIYTAVTTETDAQEQTIEIPVITSEPDPIDIDKIHSEVYKEVKDAYYTKDPFTIYPEQKGIDFDVESAKVLIQEPKEQYEIQLTITKPSKTVKEIGTEAFPDLLGVCKTNYAASNKNRTTNLILAAGKINGTVLLPGEEFSYNGVVGKRTVEAGYKNAATYSNGQVVDDIGGGICQISSTLYDAAVFANMDITVRRNHQFVTSYLPAGKDATVVWGSQDFKFKNSRKYPVRITATVSGGVATVQIWGVKEDVEYDISIETKQISTIKYTTQYVEDPSLPAGTQKVTQAGANGRKVQAYKVMKLNGQVVSRTLLSTDTYRAMTRIVRVGTKK